MQRALHSPRVCHGVRGSQSSVYACTVVCSVPLLPTSLLTTLRTQQRGAKEWRRSSTRRSTRYHRLRRAGRSPRRTWRPTSRNGGRPARHTARPQPLVLAVDGPRGTRGWGATDDGRGRVAVMKQCLSALTVCGACRGLDGNTRVQRFRFEKRHHRLAAAEFLSECLLIPRVCIAAPLCRHNRVVRGLMRTGRCSGVLQRRHSAGAFQGARRGKRVGVAAAHHRRLV